MSTAYDRYGTHAGNSYIVTPVHHEQHLMSECVALINKEWHRSYTARFRSLCSSCDQFPTNLILITKERSPQVLGHCKISVLPDTTPSVFIESVVIHHEFRGIGLGTLLMRKAEEYVLSKGMEWVYLSTQGQELFYKKLGYTECPPVNIYGSNIDWLISSSNEQNSNTIANVPYPGDEHPQSIKCLPTNSLLPPPPPPPPPSPSKTNFLNRITDTSKNLLCLHKKKYMRKCLR